MTICTKEHDDEVIQEVVSVRDAAGNRACSVVAGLASRDGSNADGVAVQCSVCRKLFECIAGVVLRQGVEGESLLGVAGSQSFGDSRFGSGLSLGAMSVIGLTCVSAGRRRQSGTVARRNGCTNRVGCDATAWVRLPYTQF